MLLPSGALEVTNSEVLDGVFWEELVWKTSIGIWEYARSPGWAPGEERRFADYRGQPSGLLQTRFERGEKARCFTSGDGAMIEGEG